MKNTTYTIGLIIMSLLPACHDCPKEQTISKITGVSLQSWSGDTLTNSFDRYSFDLQLIDSLIERRFIENNAKKENTYYATFGPFGCEIEPTIPIYTNNLESIKVSTDKEYNSIVGNDLSGLLLLTRNNEPIETFPNLMKKGWHSGSFHLSSPPDKLDTFQIFLHAKDADGVVFMDTLKNIIIGPK
jgi:hypothetical protein